MSSMRNRLNNKGLTLVEGILAALVMSIVAGGTMMAFVASANMMGPTGGWVTVPIPAGSGVSASQLTGGAKRCYRVVAENCGGVGDCQAILTRVCWNNQAGCPCL